MVVNWEGLREYAKVYPLYPMLLSNSFVFELWQAVQILVAMAPQIVAFTLQQFSERILNLDG